MPLAALSAPVLFRVLGGTALLAAVAAAGIYLYYDFANGLLEARLSRIETSRDHWRAVANASSKALELQAHEEQALNAAVSQLHTRLDALDGNYRALSQQLLTAPDEDDGPVAPVLHQALEGLP